MLLRFHLGNDLRKRNRRDLDRGRRLDCREQLAKLCVRVGLRGVRLREFDDFARVGDQRRRILDLLDYRLGSLFDQRRARAGDAVNVKCGKQFGELRTRLANYSSARSGEKSAPTFPKTC
ncbi:hypothetical protein [Burkholderia sp. Bp9004]|uniref:hypothetical protein n=1 Tax=Burkholderia sp. Bp9004 TaxID=2184559 RepID=UPI000F5DB424|nr:hypothetical protein [Burkholderia sp. Bp9004]RQZ70136.1 hypothetical protein DIE08_05980 [Burkholderia sp. Bp9004]